MAINKAGVIAGVVGTVGAPVTGYFIYDRYFRDGGGSGPSLPAPLPIATTSIDAQAITSKRGDTKAYEIKESCIKAKFSDIGDLKANMNGTGASKNDSEKLTLATPHDGNTDGCLSGEVSWRNDQDKQHAISAKLEVTLTRGNHGLIFRTLITNLLDEGTGSAFQYINQVFRLTKDNNNKWKINDGYLWTDVGYKNLTETEVNEKSTLLFKGLVDGWIRYRELCTRGTPGGGSQDQTCNKLQTSDQSFKTVTIQKKQWTPDDNKGRGVFEDISIKAGPEGKEKLGNLWGNKNTDLFKEELGKGLGLHLYDSSNGFDKMDYQDEDKSRKNLVKWFEPFKDEKGSWK